MVLADIIASRAMPVVRLTEIFRQAQESAIVRAAHRIVRAFCGEVSVPYYETSMLQSYRELLSFLHEVGRPLRATGA